ncbi:MAG: adenylate cyclase regulatory domain-containing protein [Solirubrobacterales bacterium]
MPDPTYPGSRITDKDLEQLLDGLEGEPRKSRMKLLKLLRFEGVTLKVMQDAVRADRLALLPSEIALDMRTDRYTPKEIADDTGLDVKYVQRLIAAVGFPKPDPDQRTFGIEDRNAALRFRQFLDAGLDADNLLAVTRQVGSSAAHIAQAHNEIVATEIVDPEADEYTAAISLRAAAEDLLPLAEEAVSWALRAHFLDNLNNDIVAASKPGWFGSGKETEISVCFADLVGFTRLGERSELERIGTVAKLLEQVAIDVTNPEVRLVKLIGDAAMLVSEDGAALLDASLRFIEVGKEAGPELPALRVGVARGPAIPRAGDWFGRPVNLASRITEAARPEAVLADGAAIEAAGDAFHYTKASEHKFKGVRKAVKLYRVRREPRKPRKKRDQASPTKGPA